MLKGIDNKSITIFGLAYKGNVDDIRESPSLKIIKIAKSEGMQVKVYDPLVKTNIFRNSSTIEEAVNMMKENNIKKLPVIYNHILVGIITESDITHAIEVIKKMT